MRFFHLTFLILICLLLLTCGEKFLGTDPEDTPGRNFQLLWEDFDKHYARFDYKKVDWNMIYTILLPLVIKHKNSEQYLMAYMGEMLAQLKDMHAILITPYGEMRYMGSNVQQWEHFNFGIVESTYLTDVKTHDIFTYGQISGSIGYIYIKSFGNGSNKDSFLFIDNIIHYFEDCKELVVDVRDNSGGIASHSNIVASRFVDQKRLALYWQFRNGAEHNDVTDLIPEYMEPKGKKQFTRPVALLTNRYSSSAAEDFVMKMRVLPHVTVIGDTTRGGLGGRPITRELPNGWLYRMPIAKEFSPDKIIYEEVGIPRVSR